MTSYHPSARVFYDGTNQPVRITEPIEMDYRDLETDLAQSPEICDLVHSEVFAQLLYRALCAVWWHRETKTLWETSWYGASWLVAKLRGEYGDRPHDWDWYGIGGEGVVNEMLREELAALGWEPADEQNGCAGYRMRFAAAPETSKQG